MRTLAVIFIALTIFSCEILDEQLEELNLTESEVAQGLREALRVGTDSATVQLGLVDGYYRDEVVKVLLPPEANVIVENASVIPGGDALIEKVILNINRAAEDAAKDAGPIFWGAITDMTITDAFNILEGEDNAATEYLRSSTYDGLFSLYNPKIETSLNKDIIGGVSANESWSELTGLWNDYANSFIGKGLGHKPINTDLDAYLTEKALNGLFHKIAEEEKNIRHDPIARVNDLLKRVFGD